MLLNIALHMCLSLMSFNFDKIELNTLKHMSTSLLIINF
jgi:hypothetical protein